MSGHSKWSTIKHKKAATDAKKGAVFTKLGRLIEVAAKGGADPEMNFRLKLAVAKAREANMPAANIDKAIRKGAGLDADKSQIEEALYEGIGPGNIAIMVEALTDNKNRTVSELRNTFNKLGGTLGNTGTVAWQFNNRGIINASLPKNDDYELEIIDAGAEDYELADNELEIYTGSQSLNEVRLTLASKGFNIKEAKLGFVPTQTIKVDDLTLARKILNLIDAIDELDDVSQVYSNFDISDEIYSQL